MAFYTPLSYVNKVGSAKSGTTHHIHQRATAVFLLPLMLWFVYTVFVLLTSPTEALGLQLTSPVMLIGSVLFIFNFMYHATLGLQIIIEDYIHCKVGKKIMLLLMWGFNITTTVAGLISILTIYFISIVV